jgi:hypothetical protein
MSRTRDTVSRELRRIAADYLALADVVEANPPIGFWFVRYLFHGPTVRYTCGGAKITVCRTPTHGWVCYAFDDMDKEGKALAASLRAAVALLNEKEEESK